MRTPVTAVALVALATVACGGDGEEPELSLPSPSAACEEAFVAAADAGERPAPASPRSPDLDLLRATLDACADADEWMTAVRGHRSALPVELDRSDALDQLCANAPDTPVCRDWELTVEDESGP